MWSVGIYTGDSPFRLAPATEVRSPVLSCKDVIDVDAGFVADPFMLRHRGRWYMYVEVKNRPDRKGEIGLATSPTGLDWTYRGIVLSEEFHLSYPYVFTWRGAIYMIPETLGLGGVHLYKAVSFPDHWSRTAILLEGSFADPSIFRCKGKWWMFVCGRPYQHDFLRIFFADELTGPWTEHPRSPIVDGNRRIARPAGRVVIWGKKVIRYAQDCYPTYGSRVRAFEITELATDSYREQESRHSPILIGSGEGWNKTGMHHVDPHQLSAGRWIACVDGFNVGWARR